MRPRAHAHREPEGAPSWLTGGSEIRILSVFDPKRRRVRAHRLAEVRKVLGLNQVDVAASMRVSQARVSRIERGALATAQVGTQQAYVRALGGEVEVVALLEKETPKNQVTLPEAIAARLPGVDDFDVSEADGRTVLAPVGPSRAGDVRDQPERLDITEADVTDAVVWVRER